MKQYLFTVTERFKMSFGLLLRPGLPPGEIMNSSDTIEVERPDGTVVRPERWLLPMISPFDPSGGTPIALPRSFSPVDVPTGSKVYRLGAASSRVDPGAA